MTGVIGVGSRRPVAKGIDFYHESHLFCGRELPGGDGLERVGEWWSILILRDAFHGMARFDEFQRNLGISTNSLTKRLNSLVEGGR